MESSSLIAYGGRRFERRSVSARLERDDFVVRLMWRRIGHADTTGWSCWVAARCAVGLWVVSGSCRRPCGGTGLDTVTYGLSGAGIYLVLSDLGNSTNDAAGDSFISIEKIFGTNFADILGGERIPAFKGRILLLGVDIPVWLAGGGIDR